MQIISQSKPEVLTFKGFAEFSVIDSKMGLVITWHYSYFGFWCYRQRSVQCE